MIFYFSTGYTSLVFLLLTVAGLAGLIFVTAPSLSFMFGLEDGDTDTSLIQVIGIIFVLWISTGIFVLLTIGGLLLTIGTWK